MYRYNATCLKVIDGDTMDVALDLGFHITMVHRLRLLGIDTPEIFSGHNNPGYETGLKAKARLIELAVGPLVIETHKDKEDKYGRYLAVVWNSAPLNVVTVLLAEGLGVVA